MASGFPGRDLRGGFGFGAGSAIQMPPLPNRSEPAGSEGGAAAAGGLLKRSLNEMERQQRLQLQHALFLRSVKQRTHLASPISPLSMVDLSSSSASSFSPDLSTLTSSSSSSSSQSASCFSSGLGGYVRRQHQKPNPPDFSFSAAPVAAVAPSCVTESENKSTTMRNRLLEELERRLLDDEDEDEVSASGCSAVTTSEWSETMQQLIAPPPPAASAVQNPLSPSPTTSSSSTASSSASCSPPSATPSRQMLSDTVAAIVDGNLEAAAANLAVLKRAANPRGDPEQRLTAMMVAALYSRIESPRSSGALHHPFPELCSAEHLAATQMLYDLSPCFKHALFAANLAILEATRDYPRIHILDFDLRQGSQYVPLIQALAERHRHRPSSRPPSIKITAVADPTSPFNSFNNGSGGLRMVGDWLAKLAERSGVGLRFSIVCRRAAELDEAALGCEPGEALAVNLAFVLSRVADESVSPANPRDELLRRVKSLGPRVVVLAEQDMNANTAPFAARFAEACGHYGALLESLEASVGRESAERARVEMCLARKAANSVAREGADRVERCEVFGKWRARMGMAGFRSLPLGPSVADPVKARLAPSLRSNPGFTVKEEAGGLCFGWLGRVLTVASAWR